MSQTKPQLVICGSIAIDRIMNFTGRYRDLIQPDKLHVLSISPLLERLENSRGGVGANIAFNLAQLGEKPVLLGSVGRDAQGYIEELGANGVDVTHIHYSELPTASFNVITDSEDNQVGGFYQGAMADSESLSFAPWQGQDAMLVVAAHDPKAMNRQVRECHDLNLRLVYDPGQQVADAATELETGISTAEVLFVNDYEQGLLCKRLGISPQELKQRVPVVVTTLGSQGSLIEGSRVSQPIQIDIAQPSQVADPTGAGDAYRAGFLYAYSRQWELKTCGQLGATTASFIVEAHGTQQEYTKQAVIERYRANFDEEMQL